MCIAPCDIEVCKQSVLVWSTSLTLSSWGTLQRRNIYTVFYYTHCLLSLCAVKHWHCRMWSWYPVWRPQKRNIYCTTFFVLSSWIWSGLRIRDSTSSVCSPRSGGAARTTLEVPLNLTAGPTSDISPAVLCWSFTTISLASGSSNTWLMLLIGP